MGLFPPQSWSLTRPHFVDAARRAESTQPRATPWVLDAGQSQSFRPQNLDRADPARWAGLRKNGPLDRASFQRSAIDGTFSLVMQSSAATQQPKSATTPNI